MSEASALPDEDRRRAARIANLHARLSAMEALLHHVEHNKAGLTISTPNTVEKASLYLSGVEAERLLAGMIDETSGELQALLL